MEGPDLAGFGVRRPEFIERTARATIWKVERRDGRAAALKVYHGGDMRNEAAGFRLLQSLDGDGAARVYRLTEGAALLEWLDGPSLGDLTRNGQDHDASLRLVAVARKIHGKPVDLGASPPRVSEWLESLFRLRFAEACPAAARSDLARCQNMGRELLAGDMETATLHGDLHQDNVRVGVRGDCAFDAKGVVGERAYELANAFRNPKGAPQLVRDPERIRELADVASEGFAVDRRRLLRWAAVKCALSIAWRGKGVAGADAEYDLLSILLASADAE